MTRTLDLSPVRVQAPSQAPSVRLLTETALYALACCLMFTTTVATAVHLLRSASEASLAGGLAFFQPAVLALLILILGLRFSWFLFLAGSHHWRSGIRSSAEPTHWPKVSILVPAYNEEDTIGAALASSLALDYPDFEIIFVDDGSTDRTLEVARAMEGRHHGVDVHVFTKKNGGKWSAHNLAFRKARGELILCVDADSRLMPDALRHLVRALMNHPEAGGVAGQVRVRNRINLLTSLQALEYLNCNGSTRTAQSSQGSVLVVPGPIGLFRTSVAQEVWDRFGRREVMEDGELDGPYEHDTFAEDFDFSLAALNLGHQVIYEPRAVSNTKAPETFLALLNQRYRWQRGSIQVLRKLWRRMDADPAAVPDRVLRWVLLTYAVDLMIIPLWLLLGLPYVVSTFVSGGPMATNLLQLFLLFQGINLLLVLCYASTHGDSRRLAWVLPFHDLYQTFLIQSILAFVIVDEWRGTKMRWS